MEQGRQEDQCKKCIVVGGSAMLMLPTSVFLSIYSVLIAASFVANILAGVITLGMIKEKNKA